MLSNFFVNELTDHGIKKPIPKYWFSIKDFKRIEKIIPATLIIKYTIKNLLSLSIENPKDVTQIMFQY